MMKNIANISKLALCAALALGSLTNCSDEFLKDKHNYGNFNSGNVYTSYAASLERVNRLYFTQLPTSGGGDGNGVGDVNNVTSVGNADKWSKSTEEFGGFSIFVNPSEELTYNLSSMYDYLYVANDVYSPWGHIRNCNDIIEGVTASSKLTDEEKNKLLGQAYFFRAYQYYMMVKIYGGVPIIDHVQDPIGTGENNIVPRQTTKDCVDFICNDLDKAASMLPEKWDNNDYGRVTAGTAEALKGKMLLFYASPVFNRSDDESRWEAAYEANKKALELLNQGGVGLAYATTGGDRNAANWAKIWMSYTNSDGNVSEAVFVTLHNTADNVSGMPNYGKWNSTEQSLRPGNANGGGGLTPTSEMVDLFPMADGLKPGESSIQYDKKKFWLNRDPRFYRTFAFPGEQWQFDAGTVDLGGSTLVDKVPSIYTQNKGHEYALWSYTWYDKEADQTSISASGWTADMLQTKNHAVYVRKRSDDYHLNTAPWYVFSDAASSPKGFQKSAAPLVTMRYAEVLLDFAESACGANHLDEALDALQKIRARAGYTAENNYGLPTDINGDRAKMFAAILYERQIELAYEGKRFDDMRRWMLFDGGVGQEALKPSWALTGFGGNTCTYLGVKPLNGTKRHQIILYSSVITTKDDAHDPLLDKRPAALTLDERITYNASTATYGDDKVKALAEFYDQYLTRKDNNLDGNDETLTIKFLPKYYFLGLKENAMKTNVTLHQTVGWHDLGRNADGLFDPLSDKLPE